MINKEHFDNLLMYYSAKAGLVSKYIGTKYCCAWYDFTTRANNMLYTAQIPIDIQDIEDNISEVFVKGVIYNAILALNRLK